MPHEPTPAEQLATAPEPVQRALADLARSIGDTPRADRITMAQGIGHLFALATTDEAVATLHSLLAVLDAITRTGQTAPDADPAGAHGTPATPPPGDPLAGGSDPDRVGLRPSGAALLPPVFRGPS